MLEKRQYVIIDYSKEFIQCIGIKDTIEQAYGCIYQYCNEVLDKDDNTIRLSLPIELEGDTGVMITIESQKDPNLNTRFYILYQDTDDLLN